MDCKVGIVYMNIVLHIYNVQCEVLGLLKCIIIDDSDIQTTRGHSRVEYNGGLDRLIVRYSCKKKRNVSAVN